MRQNHPSRPALNALKLVSVLRYFSLIADIPRPASVRGKVASIVFAILIFLARFSFVIGFVSGCAANGAEGMLIGLCAGVIFGFSIGRNLGLRGSNLRHGFFVRMKERGNGDHPHFLESLIEKLRGEKLTPRTCRGLTSLYAEMVRNLQTCATAAERRTEREAFDRKVRDILEKGEITPVQDRAPRPRELAVEHRS